MNKNYKTHFEDDSLPSSGLQSRREIDKHEQEFPTRRKPNYTQRLALGNFLTRLGEEEPTMDKPYLYEE